VILHDTHNPTLSINNDRKEEKEIIGGHIPLPPIRIMHIKMTL
jgi:hypothetical protein